jgi:rhodanese-related sulfurtransferase
MKHLLAKTTAAAVLSAASLYPASATALDVQLTDYLAYVEVEHQGEAVRVQRIQNQDNVLTDGFAKTSRKCPPFCIQPMQVAPGVGTVGEAEIFRFMDHEMSSGEGLLVDARTPSWHSKGTIPGSVNIPFTVFEKGTDDPELVEALTALGGEPRGEVGGVTRSFESVMAAMDLFGAGMKTDRWDFSDAKDVVFWCNGPWCGQSPRAIKALIAHGYPKEKIHYYRGGMQMWKILGLTVVTPESAGKSVAMK